MGYEPIDAWYEEAEQAAYDAAMEQYRDSGAYFEDMGRAIDDFVSERQKSFYVEHPLIAESSFNLLSEAKDLFALNHYSASQVFAGAATEVIFGEALLKPIVFGFVHSDTFAPMVADIIEGARSVYKFKELILHIASEFSGKDLHKFKVGTSSNSLWQDIDAVRGQRNKIVHKGTLAVNKQEAEHSILVATTLLETIFPSVIKSLGLHLHDAIRVCDNSRCQNES
jgi:hypothetical protein